MVIKAEARAFLGPITDEQFDKITTFLNAEGFENPTLDDFGGWVRGIVVEQITNKLHGMKQDQLTKDEF